MEEKAQVKDSKFKDGEEPKGTQGVFTLPCGYLDDKGELHKEVILSEMTGADEDILFSSVPASTMVSAVLGNRIEMIGSITDKPTIKKLVWDLMVGDRVFLMIALRRVSQGDDFKWIMKCPDCGEKSSVTLDLAELKTISMPDPMTRVYDVKLPRSGKPLRWKVLDGNVEAQRDKIRHRIAKDRATYAIYLRLDQLDGKPATIEAVKSLGSYDRQFLRDMFDEKEGGVETDVQVECSACRQEVETDLDITERSFFFPTRKPKN